MVSTNKENVLPKAGPLQFLNEMDSTDSPLDLQRLLSVVLNRGGSAAIVGDVLYIFSPIMREFPDGTHHLNYDVHTIPLRTSRAESKMPSSPQTVIKAGVVTSPSRPA
jgi:hypothetical protein